MYDWDYNVKSIWRYGVQRNGINIIRRSHMLLKFQDAIDLIGIYRRGRRLRYFRANSSGDNTRWETREYCVEQTHESRVQKHL